MNVQQLHDYLGQLLAAGADPTLPVCQLSFDADAEPEVCEINDSLVVEGPFFEDPSPKMCSFLSSRGRVLLLQSDCIDYTTLSETADPVRPVSTPQDDVNAPEKEWPNGWGVASQAQR